MRLILLLVACNQSALPPNNLGDGSVADLRATSEFCSGGQRVELNGMRADSPAVMAAPVFLNCCDAAEISVVSMQIAQPLVFMWRLQAGPPSDFPVTVDLAKAPTGWGFILASGCTSFQTSCMFNDMVSDDFTGTLTINRTANFGYEMSVCMSLTPLTPHNVIKSAKLWVPSITAQ